MWQTLQASTSQISTTPIGYNTKKLPKSQFVTVTHGLRKTVKKRCFKCSIYSDIASSQAMANNHYKSAYPPVKCPSCSMLFNSPNALRRHKYKHLPMNFPCRSCGKTFPFESDLASHHLKHHRHPGHQCNHEVKGAICGKWYFSKSDLNKHTKTHSGKVYCCYECQYTTLDIRYLRAHCYAHSNTNVIDVKSCLNWMLNWNATLKSAKSNIMGWNKNISDGCEHYIMP